MKPVCGKCKVRNQPCEYRPITRSDGTNYRFVTQSVGLSATIQKPSLSYSDLEIWHHYITNVGLWFKDGGKDLWIHHIPSIGFENQFVIHLAISFSAFHMSRNDVSRKSELILESERHNSLDLKGLIDVLSNQQGDKYEAAMIASMLVSFCYFGKGPAQGEYLLFNESGPGEWTGLIRGARSIMEATITANNSSGTNEQLNSSGCSVYYQQQTKNLRSFVQTEVENGNTKTTTLDALDPY